MAHSKKKVKQEFSPALKRVLTHENPESILSEHPTWSFSAYDNSGPWAFSKERLQEMFWDDILPKLSSFEQMTWGEILIGAKKQHHSIEISSLNKVAVERLRERRIVQDKLVSLRLNGTLRMYGFLSLSTFVILWVDDNHGDNTTCVCKSTLKHT